MVACWTRIRLHSYHIHGQFENTTKTRMDFMTRIEGQHYPPVKNLVVTWEGRLDPVLMEGDRQFTV